MKFSLIPGWLRKRVYREDEIDRLEKRLVDLTTQRNHLSFQNARLERRIFDLVKNPVGASAEEWERQYYSAMAFICTNKQVYAYDDYLASTQGSDYKEIVGKYGMIGGFV